MCPVRKSDVEDAILETHMYLIACPEFWCMIDELGESGGVKIDLIEIENYSQGIELRSVDGGHEIL